ncbi:MAG: VanZ family protein [Candidatus Omnitrophica bacterium]|nr:VanZ family protein [Candidatus Omnitrophota bacterium]
MLKKTALILWFWTPVALWMAIIYFSSSIHGEDIPKIDIPNIDKLAHFVEYFILGALLVRAFANSSDKTNFKLILLLSVLIAAAYGALDEFHQRFVSGRSPEIFDLISDIIGSLFGTLLSIHKEKSSRAIDKTV